MPTSLKKFQNNFQLLIYVKNPIRQLEFNYKVLANLDIVFMLLSETNCASLLHLFRQVIDVQSLARL